jgi:large subunit ribosomal protein L30
MKLLVKQVRSKINCPLDQRGLEALGLRKMGQVVEHDSNPNPWDDKQVKHLVSVEETK